MAFALATLNSELRPVPVIEVDGVSYRVDDIISAALRAKDRQRQGSSRDDQYAVACAVDD